MKDIAASTEATAPPKSAAAKASPSADGVNGMHVLPALAPQAAVAEQPEAESESDPEPQRAASIGSDSTQSIAGDDAEMQP